MVVIVTAPRNTGGCDPDNEPTNACATAHGVAGQSVLEETTVADVKRLPKMLTAVMPPTHPANPSKVLAKRAATINRPRFPWAAFVLCQVLLGCAADGAADARQATVAPKAEPTTAASVQ